MFARSVALVLYLSLSVSVIHAQSPPRSDDGLLADPSLQRIVDLQNARNASSLIGWLADREPRVRARAVFALASVQHPAAIPHLERLLADEDAHVRADAAFALGQTGTATEGLLSERFQIENDPAVLHEIMQALGKVGTAADLSALLGATVPAELERSRSIAASRFGMRGIISDTAVRHQLQLLSHTDGAARESAGYYFWRIRTPDPWREVVADVRDALATLDTSDPAAGYLAMALASQDGGADVDVLRPLLRSENEQVRIRAVRAMGSMAGDATARADVLSMLSDDSHHVAVTAASVVAGWDNLMDDERDGIMQRHRHDDIVGSVINGHLLTSLARSGYDADVLRFIGDASQQPPSHRANLYAALSFTSDAAATGILTDALDASDAREAVAAANALVMRWRRTSDESARTYFDAFVRAMQRRDVGLIYAVAPVLADAAFVRRGSIDALATALRQLEPPEDTEAMLSIIDALAASDANSARDALEAAAQHPHDVISRRARRHLDAGTPEPDDSVIRPIDWEALAMLGARPRLRIETDAGTFTIELAAEQAPQTVETITALASAGRYDGVPFHRVVPDFVVQGGDFARGDGFGGPGFEIRSEFTRMLFDRGVVGMASAGKDTEGSQFFITHSMQPHLDGSYTAFGRVIEGMDVVDRVRPQTLIQQVTVAGD